MDVDNGENTLPKKVRNGEIAQYNFILGPSLLSLCHVVHGSFHSCLVVGEDELNSRSVNVRNREDVGTKTRSEMIKLDEIVEKLALLKKERRFANKI